MDGAASTLQSDVASDETLAATSKPELDLDETLARGTAVARYLILERVGMGGMGIVYAAYDPELDRKVALKLVRGGRDAGALLREAQAMAKLAHPNVVTVHDVGVVQGRVFIAMEFVEGTTLAQWLATSRDWRAIVDVFAGAGAGLRAAHEAGLVHRDFKPANVLIARDGRVFVTDFGLARAQGEGGGAGVDAIVPGSGEATAATGLVGTPAYMAPEQARGERADARADQFSFCAALYEGLYRRRAIAGEGALELLLAAAEGRIQAPPKTASVPAWLRALVMRGLAAERSQRFASMGELLDRLDAGRRGKSRQRLALAGLASAALLLALAWPRSEAPIASDPCGETLHQIEGTWSAERRDALDAALRGADLRAEPVLAAIDAYTAAWTRLRHDSCTATRVAATQSDELMDLRSSCLDRRRDELDAKLELLVAGDAPALAEALRMVEQLVPLESCSDGEQLRARSALPAEPERRDAVVQGEQQLAKALARFEAGHHVDALAQLAELPALALAHAPVAAAQGYLRGRVFDARGDALAAEQAFAQAELDAARGGDDRLLVELGLVRAELVAVSLGRDDEAALILRNTEVLLTRIGRPSALERRFRMTRANLLRHAGKPDEALAAYEALQREIAAEGAHDSLEAFDVDRRIAGLLANRGEYERAQALFERGIAQLEQRLGANHPELVVPLTNRAAMYAQQGEFERSLALHDRVIALAERALGPEHPETATAHESYGVLLNHAGRNSEARRELERAEASYARSYDAGHPALARVRGNLAAVLIELDELDAAERVLVAARSDLRARYGDEHDYLVFIGNNLAELQAKRQRWDDARATIDEARRIAERRLGPQSERAGECWTLSGVIELDAGNLATALDHLERAHAILLVSEASPLFVVACEGALAQALVQSGRDDEGRALFREADARVRDGALGPEPAAELRKRAKLAGVALDE